MASESVLNFTSLSYDTAMDIFSVPACNLGVSGMKYLEHRPKNTFNSESSVRFTISGNGSDYLYLPETKLKVKLRILNADGSALEAIPDALLIPPPKSAVEEKGVEEESAGVSEEKDDTDGASESGYVSCINNFCNSLFDMVEVSLNECVISNGNTGYAYKSYINTLLNSSESVKKNRLQSAMFYPDTPGHMDDCDVTFFGGNEGLKKRHKFFNGSKPVQMLTKLDVDVFKLDRYLINGVSLGLNLHFTSTPFRLMSACKTASYKIEIMDICLIMCHVSPSNPVLVAHQELMKDGRMARYSYIREELRKFTIVRGSSDFVCPDMFQSKCPDRMVFALSSSSANSGNYQLNPFNFRTYDLNYISVTVGGTRSPYGEIKMNFDEDVYADVYEALFCTTKPRSTGEMESNSNGITFSDFKQGYALFSIELNPQTRSGRFYPTKKNGDVGLELRFAKPLKETVILLCLTYTPAYFEIDNVRGIYLGK